MAKTLKADLCVIGAGSGGLSVAAAAAQFGVKVILIEKGDMGGDCLNTGCVPSKALLSAGKQAATMRHCSQFGIEPVDPIVDWAKVNDHVKGVIASIAPNDSVERFTALGVHVIQAEASFENKKTVIAGGQRIRARRFIIATGSSPAFPPIPGLMNVPFFSNENIFENREKIEHLIVIGGGPIGMEMAQAHHNLGAKVTVLEAFNALAKDDPELTSIVLNNLRSSGIDIRETVRIENIVEAEGGITITVSKDGHVEDIKGSHLLVATGRQPNVGSLNLNLAGIKYDKRGIIVNNGMVTSNRKVFAIGDVARGFQFTHVANYQAGIVIRRALFRMPAKENTNLIPWVTYTSPELSHIGLTEEDAKKRHRKIKVLRFPYHDNDRAIAERKTDGLIKVITDKKGNILGASIVGEQAGELIQMWSLALSAKLNIKQMTGFISPYPTYSEINKRVAYGFYTDKLSSGLLRKTLSFLAKFG